MVSKIAVIALVAIVACPILLGYALNLEQTTETIYQPNDDSVNVTALLQNSGSYSYAYGDIYRMNSFFRASGNTNFILPVYNSVGSNITSLHMSKATYYNQSWNAATQGVFGHYFYEGFYYDPATTNVQVQVYGHYPGQLTDSLITTVTYCHTINYNEDNGTGLAMSRYVNNASTIQAAVGIPDVSVSYVILTTLSGVVDRVDVEGYSSNLYADISAGWYLPYTPGGYIAGESYKSWPNVLLPDNTKQYTFTVNLNSITDSSYSMHFNIAPYGVFNNNNQYLSMKLEKSTVNGSPVWTLTNEADSSESVTELYYNTSVTNNVYQFTISAESFYDESLGKYLINTNVKASYVGDWPKLIGIANSFIDYDLDYVLRDEPNAIFATSPSEDDLSFSRMFFVVDNMRSTPTMRVDSALFRSFEYQVIADNTYNAASFRSSPITTLTDVTKYGTSITFGGQTIPVKNDKIYVDGKYIKADGLELISVPNSNGGYDNKIGDTLISTTLTPSSITFNGSWSANVTTASMEAKTITKTEWTPGQFGWDGLDQNFLMVGLLTSIGVFIALGLYVRRSRSSLWPLLVVCGGAVVLFFIML